MWVVCIFGGYEKWVVYYSPLFNFMIVSTDSDSLPKSHFDHEKSY